MQPQFTTVQFKQNERVMILDKRFKAEIDQLIDEMTSMSRAQLQERLAMFKDAFADELTELLVDIYGVERN